MQDCISLAVRLGNVTSARRAQPQAPPPPKIPTCSPTGVDRDDPEEKYHPPPKANTRGARLPAGPDSGGSAHAGAGSGPRGKTGKRKPKLWTGTLQEFHQRSESAAAMDVQDDEQ